MTRNPRLEIRPATEEDIKRFYGFEKIPYTIRALAFFYNGELAGIGGVRFQNGLCLVFSDSIENVKAPAITFYRCGLEVMKMARSMGVPLVAHRNKCIEGSDKFIKAMGFTFYEKSGDEEFYVCQA